MTKNLTEGKPFSLIMSFAVPLLFGLLFQQFYNLVDTMIVGKILGKEALAAVGATGSVNFLILGFCSGVCNGFAIPVAQQFGAGDEVRLRRFVGNATWLCAIFSVVMTIFTVGFCRQILIAMRTPYDIVDQSYNYIVIIFAGIPVTYLYNMLSGIIRSLGDSKTPVIFLALSSIINIILDIVFIYVFHLGVAGAAYATVIAQFISGIACLIYMKKKYEIMRMTKDDFKLESVYVKSLCNMGIPMGLQYSITAIGSVILQTAVNTLGTDYVTAVTSATKLSMFFCCPFDALGSTMATYGGQNVGAGRIDRLSSGLKSSIIIGTIYSVIACLVLSICSPLLALLFVDGKEIEIIHNIKMFLIINSASYIGLALVNIVRFMIQGMGFSHFAVFAGIFEMIARALVGFIFVPKFGFIAVCFASPLAWLFADIFLIPAYLSCLKKLKRTLV